MPLKTNAHEQCPYDIPPPPKPDQVSKALNRRDLWDALNFFRIEALLRSQLVWNLYRQARGRASRRKGDGVPEPKNAQQWVAWYGQNKVKLRGNACAKVRPLLRDKTLYDRFAVVDGWAILLGSHHRYLKLDLGPGVSVTPDPNDLKRSSFWISEGIVDLCAVARTHNWSVPLEELQKEQERFLYLKIDASVPPTANVEQLRTLLKKHHVAATVTVERPTIDPVTGEETFPFHPRKYPSITDVRAWLKYFQCYDLQYHHSQTIDVIATKVYGSKESDSSVDVVNKAVSRVTKLIAAAEKNTWPPTNLH